MEPDTLQALKDAVDSLAVAEVAVSCAASGAKHDQHHYAWGQLFTTENVVRELANQLQILVDAES